MSDAHRPPEDRPADSPDERGLRTAIVATARAMGAAGINRGRAGNVSARLARAGCDGFLVTPTGYEVLTLSAGSPPPPAFVEGAPSEPATA